MDLREKYIDFVLENVLGSNMKVQLPNPQEDGRLFWVKLGPVVYMDVELVVVEKYTRSLKFIFKFDKYEVEKIIFIPIESSPMSIKDKLYHTLTNLVIKSFNDDGRLNDIRQMYEDKKNEMFSGISKMVGKVVEIEDKDSNKIVE